MRPIVPTHRSVLPGPAAARRLLAWLFAAWLLAGCASRPSAPTAPSAAYPLLLISLDGVRPDYLDRGITPTLSRLAREGVRAAWMTPSYPTLTFPNHYTMVTGLRPDRHGIVDNTMRDPVLGEFTLARREAVADGRWWAGEPLWVGAQRAGIRTATMFWPGSEAVIGGVRPGEWSTFDNTVTIDARVERVLGWLARPPATRPGLVTLYFEHADKAAHAYGPDSPELDAALRAVDAGLGRLLDGLEAQGLRDAVNIVIVSDHGMAATSLARTVAVDDIVAGDIADAVTAGQVLGFVPRPGREAEAEARLLRPRAYLQCWKKSMLPARWHYGTHPRVPPIVCQAEEGWSVVRRERLQRWREGGGKDRGEHGFAPEAPSMRAIFLARGPAFRAGATLPAFDNVDVYPLLARLIGVPAQPNDGDTETFRTVLEPGPASGTASP